MDSDDHIHSAETLRLNDDAGPSNRSSELNESTPSSSAPLSSIPSSSIPSSSSSKRHYCLNYFCHKDIMALSQKVPSIFLKSMPKLGFLDPSAESEDIVKGSKLELPLWLSKDLHAEGIIEVNPPKGYNESFREILEADANVVNLNKLCPNYYQFGHHLSLIGLNDSDHIAKSMIDTFHQRYHRLVNYSLNASNDTINEVMNFQSQLDNDERNIFEIARKSMEQIKQWENRSIERVTANEMVTNLRKRKRVIMEESDNDIHVKRCHSSQS